MKDFKFLTDARALIGAQGFSTASAEELRVLLTVIATGGEVTEAEKLATLCGVSKPRALAALALWEGEGVITRVDPDAPRVTEEFSERLLKNEITEEPSVKVATDIRSRTLATMLDELAKMMSEAALPTQQIKKITALYTQYSLSEEYILTLAAHLKDEGKLTVTRLVNDAIKLTAKEIDTCEGLDAYLADKAQATGDEWEIRRVLGLYGTLSPAERELFKRWSVDFGYGTPIITEAYNLARMRSVTAPLSYMNKLLTEWHDKGLTTAEACAADAEAFSKKQKDGEDTPSRRRKKSEAPTPKYGNFDANDAFMKALSRSYGDESDKK